jgi:hypothetical protein
MSDTNLRSIESQEIFLASFVLPLTAASQQPEARDACSICQDPLNESDPSDVSLLTQCGHFFHTDCILPWLAADEAYGGCGCEECINYYVFTCPNCRHHLFRGGLRPTAVGAEPDTPSSQNGDDDNDTNGDQHMSPAHHRNEPDVHRNEPDVHRNEPDVHRNEPDIHHNEPDIHHNEPDRHHHNEPDVGSRSRRNRSRSPQGFGSRIREMHTGFQRSINQLQEFVTNAQNLQAECQATLNGSRQLYAQMANSVREHTSALARAFDAVDELPNLRASTPSRDSSRSSSYQRSGNRTPSSPHNNRFEPYPPPRDYRSNGNSSHRASPRNTHGADTNEVATTDQHENSHGPEETREPPSIFRHLRQYRPPVYWREQRRIQTHVNVASSTDEEDAQEPDAAVLPHEYRLQPDSDQMISFGDA